tara:strand:- start:119 stop:226 length:108 start_codon:yes stop_codon:yes gene_type:complete
MIRVRVRVRVRVRLRVRVRSPKHTALTPRTLSTTV